MYIYFIVAASSILIGFGLGYFKGCLTTSKSIFKRIVAVMKFSGFQSNDIHSFLKQIADYDELQNPQSGKTNESSKS